nr:MAG TPA: Competence protein [Caudoviricetes sp.]
MRTTIPNTTPEATRCAASRPKADWCSPAERHDPQPRKGCGFFRPRREFVIFAMSRTTLRHNNLCERRCFALVRTAFAKMIRLRTRTLRENLRRMPMLRTLLPFAAGIVLAERFALSSWALCVGLLGCGTAAALLLRRAVSEVYLAAALLLTGWLAAELHRTPATVPRTEPTEYALQPEEQPMRRGDRFVGTARLRAWRDPGAGEWRPSAGKIILYTDTAVRLQAGERLVCRTRLRGFSGAAPGYRNLMTRRGYVGSAWVSGRSLLARDTTPASGIGRLAARLHAGAVERIERLGLSPDTRALCLAMAAGEKRALTPELREAYARSGTSHLLAVSGLHVGIVFLVVNLLLQWLNLLPGGHRWRNIAAVALIWLYAATAGLSPSVVRAALMFTALQFALASGRSYLSVNILAGTAFVMLLTDPDQLFDLSFQLSFTAVAAIIAWGVPLGRSVRTRFRPLNALTGLLAAGLTAGAATAPLIAHTFGTVPLAGLLLNPAVILLAYAVVLAAVCWMAVPVGFVAPPAGFLLETAAGAQNALVRWAAALPGGAVEWQAPKAAMWVAYLLFIAVTLMLWSAEREKTVPLSR